MLARHPGELRADMQRTYGLDLDRMGTDYTVAHAAELASRLPAGSLTLGAERPELAWTDRDWMLWSIEFSLRVLRWQATEDGRRGVDEPQPLPTPADSARLGETARGTDMDMIVEALGLDLGEVGDG